MKQLTTNILFLYLLISNLSFAQNSTVIICKSKKNVDLKTFMDTYEKSEDVFQTLHVTKKIKANHLGSKDKNLELSFNIYATKSGSKISSIYESYVQAENEILFLFENDDPKEEFSEQSIYFKLGDGIKKGLKNKVLYEMEIVYFLRCTIFPNEVFFNDEKTIQALKSAAN